MKLFAMGWAMALALAGECGAALPGGLVGDGVRDDTAAIQAMLDSGRTLVYLPPPPKEYLISKTLKIGSNTELKLDRLTRVRLAPNANCPMLQNRDYLGGTNVNIVVSGGIWDFDNAHQEPCPYDRIPLKPGQGEDDFWKLANFRPDWNEGILMRFRGVRNFTARDLTLRNPTTYSLTLAYATQFVVEHITFDVDSWNPRPLCMDGVHIDSNCHFGRIAHLRGRSCDDMVALNAHDRWETGPITDIAIEDIFVDEPAFRAVRLLSRSHRSPVKHIVIRDIRGKFYTDVVGFTRYWAGGTERGLIEDVLVENVHASRVLPIPAIAEKWGQGTSTPLFQFQGEIDVDRVTFRNIVREEDGLVTPTFWFNRPAHVREIVLRDVWMLNRTEKPILFMDGYGKVERILADNVNFEGAWENRERPPAPTAADRPTAPFSAEALNAGTPNTLTPAEKAAGWELLWDGVGEPAFVGLKNGGKSFPTKGWRRENGELSMTPCVRLDENGNWVELPKAEAALGGGGDIYTKERFRDFAFKVDFKLTRAANSGIKYFFEPDVNVGTTMEYQLLDPEHPDWTRGKDGNRRVASVYDLIPGDADRYLKPTGEWNTAMIVSRGKTVEHWLNGYRTLVYERGGKRFREGYLQSKYNDPNFTKNGKWGLSEEGRILLQDHSDSKVSFRNLKIRRFK